MAKILDSFEGKKIVAWLCTPLPSTYFDNTKDLQVPIESISGTVVLEKSSGLVFEIEQVGSTLKEFQKVSSRHIFLPFHKIDSIQLKD